MISVLSLSEKILFLDVHLKSDWWNNTTLKEVKSMENTVRSTSRSFLKRLRSSMIKSVDCRKNKENKGSFMFTKDLTPARTAFHMRNPIVFLHYLHF